MSELLSSGFHALYDTEGPQSKDARPCCAAGTESLLISEASLFTSLTAAGNIDQLKRRESLYAHTQKNSAGPVARNFRRKLIKLLLSTP